MKTKQIEVVSYNPDWPLAFAAEYARIKQALGDNCIEVHHIGSTSVPGLAAKPIIDIMLIANNLSDSIKALEVISYQYKGEYNIPFRAYLTKDKPDIKLHMVEQGHGFIELNLSFRDYLRMHEDSAKEYQKLKYDLVKDPSSFERANGNFVRYTLAKNQFIKSVIEQARFNGLMFNLCTHSKEWEEYHRIRDEQIFAPLNIIYDEHHPSLTADNHYHFVLYKGTKIVCVAHVEFLNETQAAIRSLDTDEANKRNGYGAYMMQLIEKWIKSQGRNIIKLHANLNAEKFYQKLGYAEMEFDDVSMSKETI